MYRLISTGKHSGPPVKPLKYIAVCVLWEQQTLVDTELVKHTLSTASYCITIMVKRSATDNDDEFLIGLSEKILVPIIHCYRRH